MDKKIMKEKEINNLSPIEAYNKGIDDCIKYAHIICIANRPQQVRNTINPRDARFFGLDKDAAKELKIKKK